MADPIGDAQARLLVHLTHPTESHTEADWFRQFRKRDYHERVMGSVLLLVSDTGSIRKKSRTKKPIRSSIDNIIRLAATGIQLVFGNAFNNPTAT